MENSFLIVFVYRNFPMLLLETLDKSTHHNGYLSVRTASLVICDIVQLMEHIFIKTYGYILYRHKITSLLTYYTFILTSK